MPLLHLIDRPDDGEYGFERRGQGIGAFASAASHSAALLLLIVTVQIARETPQATAVKTFSADRLVWPPSPADGGRSSGGDQSTTPARKQLSPGNDRMSATTTPQRSIDSTVDSPIEPLPVFDRPMGNAVLSLVGAVTSEPAGQSLGPNAGPGGDGPGPEPGFGDTARAGWPNVTTPIPITQVKPQYTSNAMRAKVQGAVRLECIVLADGTVGDVRLVRSLDGLHGLDEEAVAAAKKWRFKPGMMNGKPVPVIVTIELSFTLR
jgi:TonB family protein